MKYENQTLSGEQVLDGNTFNNVHFENAFVTYGGLPTALSGVTFANVTLGFHSNAQATLKVLQYIRAHTKDGVQAVERLVDGTAEVGDGPTESEIAGLRPLLTSG